MNAYQILIPILWHRQLNAVVSSVEANATTVRHMTTV